MKLRELIKGTEVLADATPFAGATRGWTTEVPEIYLGIRDTSTSTLYSLDLTREAAQKLIDQLQQALLLPAFTPEEIAHHNEHMAYRNEREKM